jgi:hypothetical protein
VSSTSYPTVLVTRTTPLTCPASRAASCAAVRRSSRPARVTSPPRTCTVTSPSRTASTRRSTSCTTSSGSPRRCAGHPEQVAAGDDADQATQVVQHRQALDQFPVHQPGRGRQGRLRVGGDRRRGHQVPGEQGVGLDPPAAPTPALEDPPFVGVTGTLDLVQQVRLGHHPEHPAEPVHHGHRADPAPDQLIDDLPVRGLLADGRDVRGHHVAHLPRSHLGLPAAIGRPPARAGTSALSTCDGRCVTTPAVRGGGPPWAGPVAPVRPGQKGPKVPARPVPVDLPIRRRRRQ